MSWVLALILILGSLVAHAAAPDPNVAHDVWQAGRHYRELIPAQPTHVADGKIEVVEVFWYACWDCSKLEQLLRAWSSRKPADVELVRIPVPWRAAQAHARLFYTLESLNRRDLHQAAFDTIFQKGNRLVALEDERTLALQMEFAGSHGIGPEDFTAQYNSSTVNGYLDRAATLTQSYQIEGVPSLVINGRYVTDEQRAGGAQALLDLIEYLTSLERRRTVNLSQSSK